VLSGRNPKQEPHKWIDASPVLIIEGTDNYKRNMGLEYQNSKKY
jgi:hypothetical protein